MVHIYYWPGPSIHYFICCCFYNIRYPFHFWEWWEMIVASSSHNIPIRIALKKWILFQFNLYSSSKCSRLVTRWTRWDSFNMLGDCFWVGLVAESNTVLVGIDVWLQGIICVQFAISFLVGSSTVSSSLPVHYRSPLV